MVKREAFNIELYKNIKFLREKLNLSQEELALRVGYKDRSAIAKVEAGCVDLPQSKIAAFAKALNVSPAELMGITNRSPIDDSPIVYFPIIGSVHAGYDGDAVEDYIGDSEPIPVEYLKGEPIKNFFVLRIKGNSMYPLLRDGESVLVKRCASVDNGSLAVVLYNGNEATVKRVRYIYGEDWLDLVPENPEYETKHIVGSDLENCRVLGKVIRAMRCLE